MTKIYLLLILISVQAFSQNRSLKEITELKKMEYSKAKKHLTSNNWKNLDNHYSNEFKFGNMSFVNQKENDDQKSALYINFYFDSDQITQNRIEFQTFNNDKFNSYLAELKTSDFNYISSNSDENQSIEIYKNELTTVEVKTLPYNQEKILYTFYIIENSYVKPEYKF
jgi:hypothetical protein